MITFKGAIEPGFVIVIDVYIGRGVVRLRVTGVTVFRKRSSFFTLRYKKNQNWVLNPILGFVVAAVGCEISTLNISQSKQSHLLVVIIIFLQSQSVCSYSAVFWPPAFGLEGEPLSSSLTWPSSSGSDCVSPRSAENSDGVQ